MFFNIVYCHSLFMAYSFIYINQSYNTKYVIDICKNMEYNKKMSDKAVCGIVRTGWI